MPARTRRIKLTERWKNKIRTTVILKRLQEHVDGQLELKPTQVKAAEILLKKTVPDLAKTEVSGPDGQAIPVSLQVSFRDTN